MSPVGKVNRQFYGGVQPYPKVWTTNANMCKVFSSMFYLRFLVNSFDFLAFWQPMQRITYHHKLWCTIWTASSEFGTYRLCEQRRFRPACASAQSHQNLRCLLIQAVRQEEPSDRKPNPWPLWMAGHVQLKFVMTECSKTQIRLTGLILTRKVKLNIKTITCVPSHFPRKWPAHPHW